MLRAGLRGFPGRRDAGLGVDLITNGAFATDVAGWSALVNSSVSFNGGTLRTTVTANGSAASGMTAAMSCVVGTKYRVTATIVARSLTGNLFLQVGDVSAGVQRFQVNTNSATGVFVGEFVATQTSHFISFSCGSGALAAQTFDVDNVSCRAYL